MKSILRALALVGALIAAVLLSSPAHAGGSGDFYKSGSCVAGSNSAKLTNYDMPNIDQEYHHSMTSGGGGYYAGKVFYNASRWPLASGARGTIRDGYQRFNDRYAVITVTFEWGNASGYKRTCQIRL